jgi:hypothetical protein
MNKLLMLFRYLFALDYDDRHILLPVPAVLPCQRHPRFARSCRFFPLVTMLPMRGVVAQSTLT